MRTAAARGQGETAGSGPGLAELLEQYGCGPIRLSGTGDALYERKLVRIQEGPLVAPLLAELSRKYAGGEEIPMELVTSGYLWLFELAPRR